jgi:hypothetical protein
METNQSLNRIGEAYLGQAMAGGLGRGALSLSVVPDDKGLAPESVQAIGAVSQGGLEGQGGHHPLWRTTETNPDDVEE